ncbi:MAG TPA: ATP-binding protein [Solirubrobacterales bacterium]|nr:ATP-binding protein [Solirubrobacterales bacterium]
MIRRLPIRVKLTLAFTVVMAAVLTATGFFLYLRLRTELDSRLDQGLHSQLQIVGTLLQKGNGTSPEAAVGGSGQRRDGTGFAQILAPDGSVVAGTEGLHRSALLGAAQLRKADAATTTFDLDADVAELGAVRILASPVSTPQRHLVVAVGTSLEDRNQALSNLRALLLVGEPIALLLAALAAYAVIGAALRPVEAMRTRAAAISAEDLGQRLPLSAGQDELRRLGETLNEMLVRLEDGLIRERAFVADASHELRTPLTMLKTELELMKRERPAGAAFDQAVSAAIGDTDRLARLTDDLLVLARADRDRLPISRQPVAIADLLGGVAERYPATQVSASVSTPAGSAAPRVVADRARLEQALGNLVDNALRYGAPPVTLSARERDGWVELHVTDEGPGLPPAFIARAFERFSQADASHGNEGTGLGLAIARSIAEGHGGSAHAANRPTGGADVWIAIPAESQAGSDAG